jgi:hypothetical protein
MDDSTPNSSSYGRLDVTVPEQEFEAGRPGTISILIKNPFNSPIEIVELVGPRSSHLQDRVLDTPTPGVTRGIALPPPRRRSWYERFFPFLRSEEVSLSFAGVRLEFPQAQRRIAIRAEKNADLHFDRDLEPYDEIAINAEEGAKVTFGSGTAPYVHGSEHTQRVEPHCDTVLYISLSTKNWLLFKPTVLQLNSLLKYRVGSAERSQVISAAISVKPPMRAAVIGAVLGAILGSLAKLFQTPADIALSSSLIAIGGAGTMSLIATIALSRKSGTQGFITVEDFYGGFAIGALIGYGGSQYFERALLPDKGNEATP